MSQSTQRKEILARFLKDVWTDGNIEAADQYVAERYTIHHDPGDPWDKRNSISRATKSACDSDAHLFQIRPSRFRSCSRMAMPW